jgi:hypothetical protein
MERLKRLATRWGPEAGVWAVFVIVSLAGALAWGGYLHESAYLAFGCARDLAAGREECAESALLLRSPLHILILWLAARAGLPLPQVGLIASALGWGAAGIALYDGGRVLRRPVLGAAAAALAIVSPTAVSTLGVEVPWVVAWACIAAEASLRRRWALQPVALALLLGTRLDPGTLALALLLWTVQWVERRRFPLLLTGVLALVLSAWAWAAWTRTPGSLPDLGRLEAYLAQCLPSAGRFLQESEPNWLFLPLIGFGLWNLASAPRWRRVVWVGLLWGAAALLSGGATGRALAHILGAVLAASGADWFLRWAERTPPEAARFHLDGFRAQPSTPVRVLLIAALGIAVGLPGAAVQAASLLRRYALRPVVYQALEGQAADWLRTNSDRRATVVGSPRLGYLADRPAPALWLASRADPEPLADFLSAMGQDPPTYIVSSRTLGWDRVARTGWFQARYAPVLHFASPYDAASPLTIWGYQASPFDQGERRPLDVRLPGQAELIGVQYWPERVEPRGSLSDAIYVTLYWRAAHPIARAFQTVVQLVAPDSGQVWEQGRALTPQSVSVDDWQPGQLIAERLVVPVPGDLPPGAHQLALHLTSFQSRALPLHLSEDPSPVDRVTLGYVVVPLKEDARAALSNARPVLATVGRDIRLLGFQAPEIVSPGETFEVQLYWSADQRPKEDYVAFVHLVDADRQLVASHDGTPMNRRYPTAAWRPGDVVPDVHPIPLGADLPAGTYRLWVGMYRWPSLERLPVWDEQGVEQPDQSLSLDTIRVR